MTDNEKIYDIVKHAQESAAVAAVPGADTLAVDAIARDIIAGHGYGEYYDHGTGHGVGRFIHELPVLNPRTSSVLEENMVYTVEPGIYIPGIGGVRIEKHAYWRTGQCLYIYERFNFVIKQEVWLHGFSRRIQKRHDSGDRRTGVGHC